MALNIIENVTVVPGDGAPPTYHATVTIDDDGIVQQITGSAESTEPEQDEQTVRYLTPAAVDLHLDNMTERRQPRATVVLNQDAVLTALDAECAAAGIGTVCIAARCEDAPGKGVFIEDAVELAEILERLAPVLACDWRIHVRVEVTDDGAIDALRSILAVSSRVVLISMMEHSVERSRFSSEAEHRAFYAADWGVSEEEVDTIMAKKSVGGAQRDHRRETISQIAHQAGIVLASHDDRGPEDIDKAYALGARVAEFPLSMAAAQRAKQLGMLSVLGAPNAVRGRSTSPDNLLVSDAVEAGVCDALCADYLPMTVQSAAFALTKSTSLPLAQTIDLVSVAPAKALGLSAPTIEVGKPLSASLGRVLNGVYVGEQLWRDGQLTYLRRGGLDDQPVAVATPMKQVTV